MQTGHDMMKGRDYVVVVLDRTGDDRDACR